jgi:putative phage-type endonuclease
MTIDVVAHVQSLDQIVQRTPEWYSARQNMLTASDVATVLGINPYEKYNSLVDKKSYGTNTFFGNAATAHGQKHEDTARFLFGRLYGLETWDVGLFRHTEIKWLGGSPDGIASDGSLLEIKCPLKRAIKHEIPPYYYPQVQLCMEILKIPKCYFIQYYPETMVQDGLLDVIEIPRSTQWFEENYPTMVKFWETVQHNRNHPELQVIKPKRERKMKESIDNECLIVSDHEDEYLSEDES